MLHCCGGVYRVVDMKFGVRVDAGLFRPDQPKVLGDAALSSLPSTRWTTLDCPPLHILNSLLFVCPLEKL
jgi:hypothetical protein